MGVPAIVALIDTDPMLISEVVSNDAAIAAELRTGNLSGSNITEINAMWEHYVTPPVKFSTSTHANARTYAVVWQMPFAGTVKRVNVVAEPQGATINAARYYTVTLYKASSLAGSWTAMSTGMVVDASDVDETIDSFIVDTFEASDFLRFTVVITSTPTAYLHFSAFGIAGHVAAPA